ncbi:microtubule-associated protein tau-like [Agrilus planipennis]|uniref:Microtubule-associated protein n=1 Tax=Agrilus planipennis TaxID=224129 RepID=A0A1W4WP30_AGRPL|nr:microtubule-associated protein tau-like [Agrilus planipennis]
MSENVMPESATFSSNMGENRNVPPSNLVPRTPPVGFQQPQRPQFDNQPPRSPQPRFPPNSSPRFAARAPEFQQRPPFPPPQQQQQQLNQDPRIRFPTQSPILQRPPAFGPSGGRPPGPIGQRPGSATIRPLLPQDPSYKPQNADPKGNLNGDIPKPPNLNTVTNNPRESVDKMEEKLNRRNEELKNQTPVKQDDGIFIQNSEKELATNVNKIREGIAERSYQRQQSLNPTPENRKADESRKELHKSMSLVQEPDDALSNQNQKSNNHSSRNSTRTEIKDHFSPSKQQEDRKNDSDSLQSKNDSQKLSEVLIKEPKQPEDPSTEVPKTMPLKEEHKKSMDDLKSSQQPDKSKIIHQTSVEVKDKTRPQSGAVIESLKKNENISDTEEFFKRKDEHKPASREDNETYRRKDDHFRPPSRGDTTDSSKRKDDLLIKQKDDPKGTHNKLTSELSKQKEDSRPSSRSSEEPPKKGNVTRPSSRPSSRLSTAAEEKGKLPTGKGSEGFSPEKKTKIEITVPSPERNQTKHKPTIEKYEKHVAQRPTSLRRSDSYKNSMGSTNLLKPDGDNDSGVDESTQGNDTRNTDNHHKSNKKSSKIPSPKASSTPTKEKSIVKGSKSPSLKSPGDVSGATTPGGSEKKKVPMNKVQVGSAPSPNLKEVKSKIGSLSNASYKPGGGQVKIENRKLNFEAKPKIAAKNEAYVPHGGEKKIISQKLQWNAKSKIGSLENATHKPKGGDKKIESVKLDFKEKAKPKVGSKDNMKYVPGGGDIKKKEDVNIENKKLDIKAQSKVGSLDNVKHRPGGGEKKIFDDKDYIRQMSGNSLTTSLTNSQTSSQADVREPTSDENLNKHH